ncbi:MAG: cytochrome c peroxidase [Dehalococcoidia bacterium]
MMRQGRVLAMFLALVSLLLVLGLLTSCSGDVEIELTRGIGPLGPVPVTDDNPMSPAKVELGKLLMFDNRMSGNESTACTGCHVPDSGWGDGGQISRGYPGTSHWRNSQTIVNSAYLQKLFWAGEALSLEQQAQSAWTGNLAGNLDPVMAEERMAQIPEYVRLFQEAFGTKPNWMDALRAVGTFERTVVTQNVPFDAFAKGDKEALSKKAKEGLMIFQGKAKCIECHNGPLFTDESYHNIGVGKSPVFDREPDAQVALRWQHFARGVPEEVYRAADRDLGLYYTTKRDEDRGKFRTPPLRYLCYTEPYMHNGVFATLEEVVDFYDQGGGEDPGKDPLMTPLDLSSGEKEALVEFLQSLCGDEILMEDPELPDYEVLPMLGGQ